MKKKKVLIIISLFLLFYFLMTFTSFFGPSLRQTNCMCKAYACRSCSADHIRPTNIGVYFGKFLISYINKAKRYNSIISFPFVQILKAFAVVK